MHKVTFLFLMQPHIIRDCLTLNGANTVKMVFKTLLSLSKLFQQKKNQTQADSRQYMGKITTLHVVTTPCLNNTSCLVTCLDFRAHESCLDV